MALILDRKLNESIAIGDDCIVTVTAIRGDRVKLGIAAPQGTTIMRREVVEPESWERIERAAKGEKK